MELAAVLTRCLGMTTLAGDLFDKNDMYILEKGGPEALSCFLKLAHRVFDAGGNGALRLFVNETLPILPAHERAEVVTMLFTAISATHELVEQSFDEPMHTLH